MEIRLLLYVKLCYALVPRWKETQPMVSPEPEFGSLLPLFYLRVLTVHLFEDDMQLSEQPLHLLLSSESTDKILILNYL